MMPTTTMIKINHGSDCLWGYLALWSAKKMPSAITPRTINPTFALWLIGTILVERCGAAMAPAAAPDDRMGAGRDPHPGGPKFRRRAKLDPPRKFMCNF